MAQRSQPIPAQAAVWPTSLKVVVAVVVAIAVTAFVFIQYVPDEQRVATSAGGFAPGGGGGLFFSPEGEVVDAEGNVVEGIDPGSLGPGFTGGGPGGRSGNGGTAAGGAGGGSAGSAGSGRRGGRAGGVAGGVSGGGGPGGAGPGGGTGGGGGGGAACAQGKNGGATDTGVSATKIRLAANVVTDGPGANFLDQAPDAMEAVIRRVNNKEGGICGRTFELTTVNDSWDANRGRRNIEDFIKQGNFALPVVPSSEGLSLAIETGLIRQAGIPVVGTEGLRKEQYDAKGKAAWVWPVATATVSQVRIMVDYATKKLGAQTFGVVYDSRYKFGVEGADAYEQYVKSIGKTLKSRVAIEPGKTNYNTEANKFKGECDKCDVVVLLLEPETGKSWMASAGAGGKGTKMTSGAQSLFNDRFARGCKNLCNEVVVWSAYNPALGQNLANPDVARFKSDLKEVNPAADETNQFTMSAYLGMEVFVHAVKQCSPNLTRACVQAKMDGLTYQTGMASALTWKAGFHFANVRARAYAIAYDGPNFTGFRDLGTGFVRDPTPGVVPG